MVGGVERRRGPGGSRDGGDAAARGAQAVRVRWVSSDVAGDGTLTVSYVLALPGARVPLRGSVDLPAGAGMSDIDAALQEDVADALARAGLPRQLAATLTYEA